MLVVFIVASIVVSCGGNSGIDRQLTKAEEIMEQHPDSAYMMLKDIDKEALSTKKEKARYALIHAKANMYMGHSLVTDTIIPIAINYFKAKGDTTSYLESVIAQAYHLRSVDLKEKAFHLIDSVAARMPDNIPKNLNQELLGFTFSDKDYSRSLDIIKRQIGLADNNNERLNFEIKKITPLVALGRSSDAVALCDSLFDLPEAPETGSAEWLYLRVNYAAALGERRETSAKAVEILKDAIERMNGAPAEKLAEFYVPMINLQLNSGNLTEATEYADMIDSMNVNLFRNDPVAATYLEFLK